MSVHMPGTDLKQVNAMFDRLDGLISFTIIRFAYTIAKNYLSNQEIVAVCMIMSILIWIVLDMPRRTSSAAKSICLSLQNVVIMVMSQAVVAALGVDAVTTYTADQAHDAMLLSMANVTGVLVLASGIAQLRSSDLVNRCVTIMLYMYADAIETLFRSSRAGLIPTLVCLLVYICMHCLHAQLEHFVYTQYLQRAFNIVVTNFILKALVDINPDASGLYVHTALYTVVLFFIEILNNVADMFSETRDYATWKVAQKLFVVYQSLHVDNIIFVAIGLGLMTSRNVMGATSSFKLVHQVLVLFVINVAMDMATSYIHTETSAQAGVLLLAYVTFIHQVAKLFV